MWQPQIHLEQAEHPTPLFGGKAGSHAPGVRFESVRSNLSSLALNDSTASQLHQLVREHAKLNELARLGLTPRRTLLLHGPVGTGKATLARALAGELQLPLARVDTRALLQPGVPQALQQLAQLMAQQRAVYLLDDRELVGETVSGEIRSAFRELLELIPDMVEEGTSASIVVVALSRFEGAAQLANYDLKLNPDRPIRDQASRFLEAELQRLEIPHDDFTSLQQEFLGLYFSDLARAVQGLAREAIVTGQPASRQALLKQLEQLRARRSSKERRL